MEIEESEQSGVAGRLGGRAVTEGPKVMIAITGAAGFIGANLAQTLARRGLDVGELILVDQQLTPSKAANLAGLDAFRYLRHDHFLDRLQGGELPLRAIFHLGACSDTTESDWNYLLRNNVQYSQTLWDWCAAHDASYVYASSAATYGDGSKGFDDTTPPTDLEPLNLYGKSKNDFDAWVLDRVVAGAPEPRGWAGLKFFNVYGPREVHKGRMASMVWHGYNQIQTRGSVRLFQSNDPAYPDGGQMRDFVFVGDCVAHMLWLWENPEVRGVFNSGTGQARTFRDLITATFHALGREPVIEYIPMPEDLVGKYQNYTQARMEKIRRAGYPNPPTSLEEGVQHYVRWLEERRTANA